MRVAILTLGTRGDVEPYVALADGLGRAGHDVTVAAPNIYQDLIEARGVRFSPVSVNLMDVLAAPEVVGKVRYGNQITYMLSVYRKMVPFWQTVFAEFLIAADGADVVVGSTMAQGYAEIAEKRGVPAVTTHLVPESPTREHPSFVLPLSRNYGPLLNRLSMRALEVAFWTVMGRHLNEFRRRLDLPPAASDGFTRFRADPAPVLCPYSPALAPAPSDWRSNHHVIGYWFLDAPTDFRPDTRLLDFLAAGPAPVYVGFGSMSAENPENTTRTVLQGIKQAGARAVLYGRWSGLPELLPNDIYFTGYIPYGWLFPRMAAVVTHGGAGTIGAVLRAGIPAVVTPFQGDQFGWSRALHRRGVAPRPVPWKKLSPDGLGQAMRQAMRDRDMRSRAADLGERVRRENGVGSAVILIEQAALR